MLCPSCNTSNDSDAAFCKHCGGAMSGTSVVAGDDKTGGFSLVMNDPGHNKINVIKLIREMMDGSLLDAKTVVDMQGGSFHHGLPEDLANKLADKLRAAGADVTVTRSDVGGQHKMQIRAVASQKMTFKKSFPVDSSSVSSSDAFNAPDAFNSPNPRQGQTGWGSIIALMIVIGLSIVGYLYYLAAIHPK